MLLKERSTVAVDTGSTMAMESRILMLGKVTHFASLLGNSVTNFFNDKPFICSKMTNLKAFHSSLYIHGSLDCKIAMHGGQKLKVAAYMYKNIHRNLLNTFTNHCFSTYMLGERGGGGQ